ncbi:hypothetical protein [Enterovirga rhinocerotis]|uniref:hypothetical protein n=1 Tax=Enterovirga rhinocerotis TaxID=1339210 RepID=UPI00106203D8|nr:hypothetical protein [Enterovirga rhinocerotis]
MLDISACRLILTGMSIERTTVRLPADLMDKARRKAAAGGSTLAALIEEGLRQVVRDKAEPDTARRRLPRISRAGGGLLPGIDLDRSFTIREIEDLDDAGRLTAPHDPA